MCIDILSIIADKIIGVIQIIQGKDAAELAKRQDKRDEKRYQDDIFSEATKFIQKYSKTGEIQLLPNCVMAYKYNLTFPYRREMYSDFNALKEEIRQCVLERCHVYLDCKKEENFYDKCLDIFQELVSSIYGKEIFLRYFNEGAKYFHASIEELKNTPATGIYIYSKNDKRQISYKYHITDVLCDKNTDNPIAELFAELDNSDEIDLSYRILKIFLNCKIIKWLSFYNNPAGLDISNDESLNVSNSDYEMQHSDDWYMEDLFLDALLYLYVYQIKYKDFTPIDDF